MMNGKNIIACPACEYERNSPGQPVERNGQMQCLDCGSSWRVFGTLGKTSNVAVKQKTRAKELAGKVSFETVNSSELLTPYSAGFHTNPTSYKLGLGTMMSCFAALLLLAGMYLGMMFLERDMQTVQMDVLNIAEVEIEEQVRRNGQKVFTVKGLVSNPTDISRTIPPIAIILRKQNGSEITRWYYNSSLASLRAGGKSRFASSIQYDTPIVAYAEAVFK